MAIEMSDVNNAVTFALAKVGLEPTIDNRVEALAFFAKRVAETDKIEPDERVRIALEIAVEIVRLRTEKQMFGLD